MIGVFIKICAVLLGIYFILSGEWPYVFLLLPVFFIDSLLIRIRKDAIGTLVKFLLLAQAAAIWYLSSSQLFSEPLQSEAHHMVQNRLNSGDGGTIGSFSARQQQVMDTFASIRRSSSYLLDKHIKPMYDSFNAAATAAGNSARGVAVSESAPGLSGVQKGDGTLGYRGSAILRRYAEGNMVDAPSSSEDSIYFPVKALHKHDQSDSSNSSSSGSSSHINTASAQVIVLALTQSASAATSTAVQTAPNAPAQHVLLDVDFPDLRPRSPQEVRARHPVIFGELPVHGFDAQFSPNPCWYAPQAGDSLQCLPYAYILGQPKSGTSDLFERLRRHQSIV